MSLQSVVSRNVRLLIAANALSQAGFAQAVGLSQAGLSDKLHGRRKWSLEDLERIAETYRIDMRVLLTEAWQPAELPGAPNKVTYSAVSFGRFGRRGRLAAGSLAAAA